MENVLMRFLRRSYNYSPGVLARKLGISTYAYYAMEKGIVLMTWDQAKQLGKIYNINPSYLYKEAHQLDLLLTSKVVIRILKSRIDLLSEEHTSNINQG